MKTSKSHLTLTMQALGIKPEDYVAWEKGQKLMGYFAALGAYRMALMESVKHFSATQLADRTQTIKKTEEGGNDTGGQG